MRCVSLRQAMPFVSVVTPFFNSAPYLEECVESVLAQKFEDFEYLLIDNHSTDGSSEIAHEFARKDGRVRVIKPPSFLPQVHNYNFGLSQIDSKAAYFKIVAADDWLFPPCLTEMVALAENNPSVAIVSSYRMREARVDGQGLHPSRRVLAGREACRLHLRDGVYLFGSPSTILFRADLLQSRKPFYETGRLHEDTEAVFEILRDRDFGFVHQVLSFSRQQLDSTMGARRGFVPDALDRLIIVSRFGSTYLEPEEYRASLRHATRWHYSVMAQAWLQERVQPIAEGFWDYQRKGLATIGQDIDPKQLAAAVARLIARSALTPLATSKSLLHELRNRS